MSGGCKQWRRRQLAAVRFWAFLFLISQLEDHYSLTSTSVRSSSFSKYRLDECGATCLRFDAGSRKKTTTQQILHLHRFFAGEISLGILFKRNPAAGTAEIVDLTVVSGNAATGITGIDVHAAHRVDCGFGL